MKDDRGGHGRPDDGERPRGTGLGTVHVALFRGINLGPSNRLPMRDLARLFGDAGAANVRTHLNSGNVVFSAPDGAEASIIDIVRAGVAARFGLDVPILSRSGVDLARIALNNPFLPGAEERSLHVAFLSAPPAPERAAALDPKRSPGDAFALRGSELYLRLPNGVARTRLTNAYLDSTLGRVSTVRTWKTVTALRALAGGDTAGGGTD